LDLAWALARKPRPAERTKEGKDPLESSSEVLKSLLEKNSSIAVAHAILAHVEHLQGNDRVAARHYEAYLENAGDRPAHQAHVRLRLAHCHLTAGDVGKASAHLLQLPSPDSKEHRAVRDAYLAWVAFYRGKPDEALELQTKAYQAAASESERGEPGLRLALLKGLVYFYSYTKPASGAKKFFSDTLVGADAKRLGRVLWSLMDLYFTQGRLKQVVRMAFLRDSEGVDGFSVTIALVDAHLGLGEETEAYRLLEKLSRESTASKEQLSGERKKTLKKLLLEQAKVLHDQYTRTLVGGQGAVAADYYALLADLPYLSEAEQDEIRKLRAELRRFRKQVKEASSRESSDTTPAYGSLTSRVAERVAARHRLQMIHCLRRTLLTRAPRPGRLVLQLEITPAGAVTEASIGSDSPMGRSGEAPSSGGAGRDECPPDKDALCRCLVRKAHTWRFPAYRAKSKPIHLQVPLKVIGPTASETSSPKRDEPRPRPEAGEGAK
jgi:tetratricopeptide (TPR) repeat protein